ncbi:MAG TPA: DNA methyltransferase [Candidatus Acidoferrales bacterium]|nr:DNA methyltransferase [Candidatus Acidoferrales bacterium]
MLKTNSAIVSELDKIDWNFPRARTWVNALHALHWFPGNFIPQIPSYLIQSLSAVGDVVFDPFCGSCTSGVEALILGRQAWMSDFSPVSHLLAESKLRLLVDPRLRKRFVEVQIPPLLMTGQAVPENRENLGELRAWFHKDTLEQLQRLWAFIATCREVRAPLEMLFSDTLFACASTFRAKTSSGKKRRHHWGWVADNVRPKPPVWHDALRYFEDRLHRAKLVVSQLGECRSKFRLKKEDIRLCSYESGSADLVVTSPPYLGMIDYTTANRLLYLWHGWDLPHDRAEEIGARSRRNALSAPEKYLGDIEIAADQISRVLKPGAPCALVIGASRKYPEMALKAIDEFGRRMKLIWGPTGRIPTRRRVSDRKGTPPAEYICVLRKE